MNRSEKLERALRLCMEQMCKYCLAEAQHKSTKLKAVCENGCETLLIAKEASEEPPRNCDVGTAEEQADRYLRFCRIAKPQVATCDGCPLSNTKAALCEFAWSQMPYEAQEGGGK